jgi:hypothetical protein
MSSAPYRSWRLRGSLGLACMLTMTAAAGQVAAGSTGLDTSGNYQTEVQACKAGRTGEDEATCLREARNAHAERKRGGLDNSSGQFEANALARCSALKGDDKAACEARMLGHGQVSGSVAGGGLLREIETVISPPPSSNGTSQPGDASSTPSSSGGPAPASGLPPAPSR